MFENDHKRKEYYSKIVSKHLDLFEKAFSSKNFNKLIKLLKSEPETIEIALIFSAFCHNQLQLTNNHKSPFLQEITSFNIAYWRIEEIISIYFFKQKDCSIKKIKNNISNLFKKARLEINKQTSIRNLSDEIINKINSLPTFTNENKKVIINIANKLLLDAPFKIFFTISSKFFEKIWDFSYQEITDLSKVLNNVLFNFPLEIRDILYFETLFYKEYFPHQEKIIFMIISLLVPKLIAAYPDEDFFFDLDEKIRFTIFSYSLERYFFNESSPHWISGKYNNYLQGFIDSDKYVSKQFINIFNSNNEKLAEKINLYKNKKRNWLIKEEDAENILFLKMLVPVSYYYDYFIMPMKDDENDFLIKRAWKARILDMLYYFNETVLKENREKNGNN